MIDDNDDDVGAVQIVKVRENCEFVKQLFD